MKELDLSGFECVDIKSAGISKSDLEEMYRLQGSYADLFSKRAQKFRGMGLHEQTLTEEDYKHHIATEYTFLKRPVAVLDDQIFVSNSKKNVAAMQEAFGRG